MILGVILIICMMAVCHDILRVIDNEREQMLTRKLVKLFRR